MLQIIIPQLDVFNNETDTFSVVGPFKLQLEHSLVSISKWESITKKPFLVEREKTNAELMLYIECMTISQNNNRQVYQFLTRKNLKDIIDYMEVKQTATLVNKRKMPPTRETITSELIYSWMIDAGIPFECQKWHLSRLLTLIELHSVRHTKPTKMSQRELIERNKALNDERKARHNTTG